MPDSDTSTEFIFGSLSAEAGRVQRARTLHVGLQHDAVLNPIDPQPDEPIEITVRAGVGAALKRALLCYTTDGTLPETNPSSTARVLMVRTAIEWDTLVWAHIETWSAVIPPQPAGTRVRYLITATTLDDRVIACPWIGPATPPEDYDQPYLARLQRYGSPRIFEFTLDTTTAPDWLRQAVIRWGRFERRCKTLSPDWLNAWMISRTVWSSQPTWRAIAGACSPRALAKMTWQRRTTKPSEDRVPRFSACCSVVLMARTKIGGRMSASITHYRQSGLCLH